MKPCLCGDQHRYKNCFYITPSERPQGWKGRESIFIEINKKIGSLKNRAGKPLKSWFLKTFKYDGFENPPILTEADKSKCSTIPNSLGVFTTNSSFEASSETYKLYHSWTLDGASDIHVCNDPGISHWIITREATIDDVIFAGKTSYPIEAFGTVVIDVQTNEGSAVIQLEKVALARGFMTNIVSLDILSSKGVHWNSENPGILHRNHKEFCQLQKVGKHWTLQKDVRQLSAFSTISSYAPRAADVTAKELHTILAHASTEVISQVKGSDIHIDYTVPCPTTIECETCSLTKAKKQISRRKKVEYESNGNPFFRIAWDMMEFERAYNGDNYGSHIRCCEYKYEFSSTHPTKPGALKFFKNSIIFIEENLGYKVHYCRLDGETTFGQDFRDFIAERGISEERTAPYTPEQNGGLERSGGIIVIKARSFIIGANLPTNLWNEAFITATYIKNRTPHRSLGWKTPYEMIHKIQPTYAHMHPYGCRAYVLENKIPHKLKMLPRAHIGYLVGYNSRNIYRIWIPSKKRVIRTRDVTFDHDSYWAPDDLDIGDIMKESVNDILKALEIPQADYQKSVIEESNSDFIENNESSTHGIVEKMDEACDLDNISCPEFGGKKSCESKTKSHDVIIPHLPSPRETPEPQPLVSHNICTNINENNNDQESIFESHNNAQSSNPLTESRVFQGMDTRNILQGKRSRRNAHSVQKLTCH